jgi:predicted dehydrogenase
VVREGAGLAAADLAVAFTTEGGAAGTLLGTAGLAFQHPLIDLSLNYAGGRLHLRDLDGLLEVFDAGSERVETYDLGRNTSRWDQYAKSFVSSLEAYLGSVRDGVPPPVPGLDGLRELQVEAGIRRSVAEGRRVVLGTELAL